MGLTDKMKWRLRQMGWNEGSIAKATFEEASEAINQDRSQVKQTPQAALSKANNSMLVSYAKDLIIAGKSVEEAIAIVNKLSNSFS